MRISVLSMFTAFAIVLSYVESLFPTIGIQGVKLGLANLAVVLVIYMLGVKEAAIVNGVRIVAVGFMFGNLFSIVYSMAGALFSLIAMAGLKKTGKFHIPTVSIAGGVAHNIGQLIIAALVVESYSIVYYMPILIISGIITGIAIGIIADIINKRTGNFIKISCNKEV